MEADYCEAVVGSTNLDAAWYYPNPSRLARHLESHVVFWHGVRVGQA